MGKYAEAEPILLAGYKGVLARQNTMPFENREMVDEVREAVGRLYKEWGRPAPPISVDH